MQLNVHGQPLDARINERLRVDRAIHEMLGLVKGGLIDGVVTDREARALDEWLAANPDAVKVWPGYVLSTRLRRIIDDGRVDDDEQAELHALFTTTVATQERPDANPTTELPLDVPAPALIFSDQTYLFTGEFVYGTRRECQEAVVARGGRCIPRVNQQVNVLVIGCVGSRDWAHTSFGRKIEDVVRLKRRGFPVTVVGEDH